MTISHEIKINSTRRTLFSNLVLNYVQCELQVAHFWIEILRFRNVWFKRSIGDFFFSFCVNCEEKKRSWIGIISRRIRDVHPSIASNIFIFKIAFGDGTKHVSSKKGEKVLPNKIKVQSKLFFVSDWLHLHLMPYRIPFTLNLIVFSILALNNLVDDIDPAPFHINSEQNGKFFFFSFIAETRQTKIQRNFRLRPVRFRCAWVVKKIKNKIQ